MSNRIAVIISDVHYNLQTLPLADAAMRQAINKANELEVPLIVSGDLHDTKANLRGECVKTMIETFRLCEQQPYVIVGNHDLINEKSTEHSLEFLRSYVSIVDLPTTLVELDLSLIPYQNDVKKAISVFKVQPTNKIICHQGLKTSLMGDYIQDHSAIDKDDVSNFRVISGHYHYRQDIKIGRPQKDCVGLWSYVGNPYTLTWGEANDPEKGYQILHSDGTLKFVPTNLRKHVIIECTPQNYMDKIITAQSDDLLWIKMTGTVNDVVTRKDISTWLNRETFKFTFDYIPQHLLVETALNQTQEQILDGMLDKLPNSDKMKAMWRKLCE